MGGTGREGPEGLNRLKRSKGQFIGRCAREETLELVDTPNWGAGPVQFPTCRGPCTLSIPAETNRTPRSLHDPTHAAAGGLDATMHTPPALPPLFLSHGSPMIALEPREAGLFMQRLGPALERAFGRPRAVLAISAHSLTREPVLLTAREHRAVYDFGPFDPRLHSLRYDVPGDPALAEEVWRALHQGQQQAPLGDKVRGSCL